MSQFPHLLFEERVLWRKFLTAHEHDWDRYLYDLHVGQGRPGRDSLTDDEKRQQLYLSQKRIDVIGQLPDKICIFEIRPRASMSQVGQLLCYRLLYQRQTRDPRPCDLAILTTKAWPDERFLFDHFAITIYEFPL